MTTGRHTRSGLARTGANRHSVSRRMFWLSGGLIVLVAIAVFLFGYWWLYHDREPVNLKIGAGPVGSDSFVLMREIADVVSRHSQSLRLTSIATRDPSENIARLNAGTVDLAVIRADTPVVSDIRIVADLYSDYFHLIVDGKSGAREIADILDLRVALPQFGTDSFRSFWIVAEHYDLPLDGFQWTATDFETGREGLISGRFDALFTVRSLRDQALLTLFEDAQLKGRSLHYIPVRQVDAIALKRPFLAPGTIPAGAFIGSAPVPSSPMTTGTVGRTLVTRSDVSEAAIRELTEILMEHRLDLTIRFELAAAIGAPQQINGLDLPLHAGAFQYYSRDQPGFFQENAEPIALVVTICAMMFSALLALRSRLVARQKNRADRYNYQLLELNARAANTCSRSELVSMRTELNNILENVVIALDTDEVSDEGFQSFALLWESVRDSIRDRMAEFPHDREPDSDTA